MDHNTEIVHQFLETMSTEGVEAALTRYASPDVVWWSAGSGEVQDKIVTFMTAFGSQVDGPVDFTILGTTTEGQRVAVEASLNAALLQDRHYSNRFHFLFIVVDGLITRINEYHDTRHAYDTLEPTLREAGFIHG